MTATLQTVLILKMLLSTAQFVRETPAMWAVNNHWTGLLEWTTGLTLKIIFILSNKIQLPVELHSIRNGT